MPQIDASTIAAHYAAVRQRLRGIPSPPTRPVLIVTPPPPKPRLARFNEFVGPKWVDEGLPIDALVARDIEKIETRVVTVRKAAQLIVVNEALRARITRPEFFSERRTAEYALARHRASYRISKACGWSLPQIGAFLERDHTTVLHSLRRMAKLIAKGDVK